MDIEDKLLKFRQESSLKKLDNSSNSAQASSSLYDYFKPSKLFQSNQVQATPKQDKLLPKLKEENQPKNDLRKRTTPKLITHSIEDSTIESDSENDEDFKIKVAKIVLKILLWLILFVLFIQLEFGAVYFVISLLIIIYLNTSKRKNGQISAYSVFNPNMERIQGNSDLFLN